MSDPDFEHSDGGWDDLPPGPNWGESQWREYLKGTDRDNARFLSIYNSLKHKPDHLDEAAALMGWDVDDMAMTGDFHAEAEEETVCEPDDEGPYTLHRHPVFVVSRALYYYLRQSWEHYLAHNQHRVSPQFASNYGDSLHQGEINVLLAVQALDLADFGLTICHLKNALAALNHTLALLDQLSHPNSDFVEGYRNEVRIRLFDLRELWLRVMRDCRTECQRRPGDDN